MRKLFIIMFLTISFCRDCKPFEYLLPTVGDSRTEVEVCSEAYVLPYEEPTDSEYEEFYRNKSKVNRLLGAGNSLEALQFIKMEFKYGYPTNPQILYEYAMLMNTVCEELRKADVAAAMSMDFSTAISTTFSRNEANLIRKNLLVLAANGGHEAALRLIQLEVAINGNNNGYYNNNNGYTNYNSGNTGSSVVQKRCSLCNGTGWMAGNKAPVYADSHSYWCSTCNREVPASHSHERCSACGGKGYTTGLR